ncbi:MULTISPECIES: DUF2304 domain-containing protein [Microbacterium]|jgi:hypothetical protein|uniref:DUF2304 domain-containing protein n=1 Tax=Microbacterium TaxID=33882 RepID=UPI001FFD7D95|nr:DUF2304 domain-containing protein [Microbacterium galbinum]MCK2028991.1 DUF2304 domain-containing protein [Microbacterium galbinum]
MIVFVGIALAVLILVIVLWMLLTRKLREKYAVLWLVIAVSVLIVGLFPGLLGGLTALLGVQVPSNLLFATAILLLLGVALHLSWELSQVEEETRRLAEEAAILRTQLESVEGRLAKLEAPRTGSDGEPS